MSKSAAPAPAIAMPDAVRRPRDCYPFADELQRAREWRTGAEGHFRPDPKGLAWKKGNPALDRAALPRSDDEEEPDAE